MATNTYPGVGYLTVGRDWSYFTKVSVSSTTFGGGSISGQQPDIIIPFQTQAVQFLNLGSGGTSVIEYSFNGTTVHGELNPTNASAGLTFDNRIISLVWFRVQSGSSGTIVVSVQAWNR
jgi:hypothetical protein